MAAGDDDTIASTSLPTLSGGSAALPELIAGRYRIARWLGGGGMGRVYAAVDTELGEEVALKVLREGLSDDAIERFRREVRLTRRIQHRNVARMFDIGEHAGLRFLTMELIEGVALARRATSAVPWPELVGMAEQLCAGLAAAHAAGVVHRDLKPDNILVERATGRLVITDFGIARSLDDPGVTQVGAVIGTPRYMSPEQLGGAAVDERSDVFALGVILYELATGARPWSGDHPIAIAVAQATQPMRPLGDTPIPAQAAELLAECLALAPGDRPATGAAVGARLAALPRWDASAPAPATAVVTSPPHRASVGATPAGAPSTGAHPTSLAVLPIACAAGDEYLADGLLDDLIDGLSSARLRVRPAGHLRQPAPPDPRAIGRELTVDQVVTGAIRRTATGLRVSARVISVADGFQVWAHRADCAEAEILAVADQLAQGIAAALSTQAVHAPRPTDPRAVELYLRARAELRRFWGSHAAAAAELLDRAVAIAPESAPILAAHALATVQAWVMTTDPELEPRARAALQRGLATEHGEAYLAASMFHSSRGEVEPAARALRMALARAPMSAPIHEAVARLLVEVDGIEPAIAHFETAMGLDPGRQLIISGDLARIDALRGDFDAARQRLAPLLADADPSLRQLGAVYTARFASWRGDRQGMTAAASAFVPRMGVHGERIHAYLMAAADESHGPDAHQERWRTFLAEYVNPALPIRNQLMGLQLITEVTLCMERHELALDALAQVVQMGLMDMIWIDHCPLLVGIAGGPRVQALRAQVIARADRVRAAFYGD